MITLGNHSYMGVVYERFEPVVEVGNFSSIADNVYFHGRSEHPWVGDNRIVSNYPFKDKGWSDRYPSCLSRGPITIGSDVWICESVIILDGVNIGDGAIIGAGAVVGSDVSPYTVMVGNLAKASRMRFEPEQVVKLMKLKWWNWTDDEIKEMLPDMKDINVFLKKYFI